MNLYEEWTSRLENHRATGAEAAFFNNYISTETEAYRKILESGATQIEGKITELAEANQMDAVTFMGFLDGIRTSLDNEINLEELDENSELKLSINLEKLYYNMLGAKANWLYNLPEWDARLTAEKRMEIRRQFRADHQAVSSKVGRNDPCPCGSGKKYKKCCGA
jgi:uncharacterized protein YecA (UPF0149 family)